MRQGLTAWRPAAAAARRLVVAAATGRATVAALPSRPCTVALDGAGSPQRCFIARIGTVCTAGRCRRRDDPRGGHRRPWSVNGGYLVPLPVGHRGLRGDPRAACLCTVWEPGTLSRPGRGRHPFSRPTNGDGGHTRVVSRAGRPSPCSAGVDTRLWVVWVYQPVWSDALSSRRNPSAPGLPFPVSDSPMPLRSSPTKLLLRTRPRRPRRGMRGDEGRPRRGGGEARRGANGNDARAGGVGGGDEASRAPVDDRDRRQGLLFNLSPQEKWHNYMPVK